MRICRASVLILSLWSSSSAAELSCNSDKGCIGKNKIHEEEVVSLMQLGKPQPTIRDFNKGATPMEYTIATEQAQQRQAGIEGELDEHPNEMYNWGVRWNDWYDDLMHLFPPQVGLYEVLNYGMVTEKTNACAAKVKAGKPGYTLPFNYTSAANLYEELVRSSPVNLKGAKVLDISSGRGGATAFLSDCFCPAQTIGIDFTPKHVQHAKKHYQRMKGSCPIKYLEGNAMELPFEDNTFDAVINVQGSFEYPSYRMFAKEAKRVLKPGGAFLSADFRYSKDGQKDTAILEDVFRQPVNPRDVSQQVLASFDQNELSGPFEAVCFDKYRKAHGVALTQEDRSSPAKFEDLWTPRKHGVGVKNPLGCAEMSGSLIAESIREGAMQYRFFVAQKKEAEEEALTQEKSA
jgi:SAM-dependent methyltransferase